MSFRKHLLVGLVLGAAVLGPTATATATEATGGDQVTLDKIGRPTWKPVDFSVFTGPIGTGDSDPPYAEYQETLLDVLRPPAHVEVPGLGVGPGAPHPPPYRHELSRGVRAAGYDTGRCFTPDEFSTGDAVIAAWMVVPHARRPSGSSPDFDRGPIIPNEVFPIQVVGVSYRNGEVFDAALVDFEVPALDDELDPPFDVDGHSHFPMFIADSAEFGPAGIDLRGRYAYEMTMTDNTGAGWKIVVSFTVRDRC